ncbi:hypothetical protein ACQZ6B_03035 [Agrobacterium vitis]
MFAFMAAWPTWSIYALVGGLFGLCGGLIGALLFQRHPKIAGGLAIVCAAISGQVTDRFVMPQITNDLENADLPKKIDDVTTMNKVEIEKHKVRYLFSVDPSVHVVSGDELRSKILPSACAYWKPKFASGEFQSAEYAYSFADGSAKFLLTQDNCK